MINPSSNLRDKYKKRQFGHSPFQHEESFKSFLKKYTHPRNSNPIYHNRVDAPWNNINRSKSQINSYNKQNNLLNLNFRGRQHYSYIEESIGYYKRQPYQDKSAQSNNQTNKTKRDMLNIGKIVNLEQRSRKEVNKQVKEIQSQGNKTNQIGYSKQIVDNFNDICQINQKQKKSNLDTLQLESNINKQQQNKSQQQIKLISQKKYLELNQKYQQCQYQIYILKQQISQKNNHIQQLQKYVVSLANQTKYKDHKNYQIKEQEQDNEDFHEGDLQRKSSIYEKMDEVDSKIYDYSQVIQQVKNQYEQSDNDQKYTQQQQKNLTIRCSQTQSLVTSSFYNNSNLRNNLYKNKQPLYQKNNNTLSNQKQNFNIVLQFNISINDQCQSKKNTNKCNNQWQNQKLKENKNNNQRQSLYYEAEKEFNKWLYSQDSKNIILESVLIQENE